MRARVFVLALLVVALAGGVALGAGPLQRSSTDTGASASAARAAVAERDAQIEQLRKALDVGSAYAGATAARVVAGTLTGRKVAVVSFPGVGTGTVRLLTGLVHAAGGEVTAQVGLAASLLAGKDVGLLDALTSQMAAQSPGAVIPPASNGFQRLGGLLARAVAVPPSTHAVSGPYDATAVSILSGLQTAKIVEGIHVSARAGLTLVVLPNAVDAGSVASATALLAVFGAQIPTVVVGPASVASPSGLLTTVRRSAARLSTVDGLETSTGRVSAVLALAARTRGVTGDFGAAGDAGAAVPPLP